LVFVTKYRRGALDAEMLDRCEHASCGGAPLEIVKEYLREQKRPDQGCPSSRL
jgi:REP element-mobilizing transposase RayT